MKKFRAFTLAETLITLMIIGVVAAITIPTLMNNINDNILKNQRKTTAAKVAEGFRNMMAHGALAEKYENTQKFADAMKKYFNISQVCDISNWSNCISDFDITDMGISMGEIMPLITDPNAGGGMISIKLADGTGMLIRYYAKDTGLSEGDADKVRYIKDPVTGDMIYAEFGPATFVYLVDVNGNKGPNTLGKDIIGDFYMFLFGPPYLQDYGNEDNPTLHRIYALGTMGWCNGGEWEDCYSRTDKVYAFDGAMYDCHYCKNFDGAKCGTCEKSS